MRWSLFLQDMIARWESSKMWFLRTGISKIRGRLSCGGGVNQCYNWGGGAYWFLGKKLFPEVLILLFIVPRVRNGCSSLFLEFDQSRVLPLSGACRCVWGVGVCVCEGVCVCGWTHHGQCRSSYHQTGFLLPSQPVHTHTQECTLVVSWVIKTITEHSERATNASLTWLPTGDYHNTCAYSNRPTHETLQQ